MSSRAGKILAAAVAGLLLLAVVAGVISAVRDTPRFPAGSPEATVQSYLEAVFDQDFDKAMTYLAEDTPCTVNNFPTYYPNDATRVVHRDSRVDAANGRVFVHVDVINGDGGPFGQDGWTDQQTFEVTGSGDTWHISGVPWPLGDCNGVFQ